MAKPSLSQRFTQDLQDLFTRQTNLTLVKSNGELHFNGEIPLIITGEITNLDYLQQVAKIGKNVILSTGMSTISEIANAVSVLRDFLDDSQISILHCTTEYPAPFEEVNLNVIKN